MSRRILRRTFLAGSLAGMAVGRSLSTQAAIGDAPEFIVRDQVWIAEGTIPLIISAPHGGREPIAGATVRTGQGVRRFTTLRDENTAEIALALARQLAEQLQARPWVVIARFERRFADANRAPGEAYESEAARVPYDSYHRALRDACDAVLKQFRAGLLLDIHGQSAHSDSLLRGTNNLRSVANLISRHGPDAMEGPHSVFGQLAAAGYDVLPKPGSGAREVPEFDGGYIVTEYGAERPDGVDAIQLEFGRKYRIGNGVADETAADLASAVAGFCRKFLPAAAARADRNG